MVNKALADMGDLFPTVSVTAPGLLSSHQPLPLDRHAHQHDRQPGAQR